MERAEPTGGAGPKKNKQKGNGRPDATDFSAIVPSGLWPSGLWLPDRCLGRSDRPLAVAVCHCLVSLSLPCAPHSMNPLYSSVAPLRKRGTRQTGAILLSSALENKHTFVCTIAPSLATERKKNKNAAGSRPSSIKWANGQAKQSVLTLHECVLSGTTAETGQTT